MTSSPVGHEVGNPDVGVARKIQVRRYQPLPSNHGDLELPNGPAGIPGRAAAAAATAAREGDVSM